MESEIVFLAFVDVMVNTFERSKSQRRKTDPKVNKNDEQWSKEPSRLAHCDCGWMMKDEDEKEGIYPLDIYLQSSGHGQYRVFSIMSLLPYAGLVYSAEHSIR